MPVHLAIGINTLKGTITFNDERVKVLQFGKTFTNKPHVILTGNQTSEQVDKPFFTTQVTKSDCIVKTKEKFTGEINYIIIGE